MQKLTRRDLTTSALITTMAASATQAQVPALNIAGPWTERGEVQVAAGKMAWKAMGSGEPLIMMPKLGGWAADWRHIAPTLATKFRVIAIDNPGHGDSVMNGPPPFLVSLRESAAMVMATLDALNIQTCSAIGNSLGGCILTVAAGLYPDAFRKLILLSVALGGAATLEALEEGRKKAIGVNYDAQGLPIIRSFENAQERFGIADRAVHDEQNASRAKGGAWVAPSERGVGRAGVVNYLPMIKADTLLIYGERGGYKQFEKPGKAGLKKVRSVHIPNAGSFTHQDNPTETARVALEFLTT
ncbi:MAG: alpha/beta hydrolase [Alphaproteobacteria bacterium]|nr:alpha/beta hydrolase [Alphaproteobacteria bacterium]